MMPKSSWIGKNLLELDLRNRLQLNVVAVRTKDAPFHFVDPKKPFTEDDILLIVTEKEKLP